MFSTAVITGGVIVLPSTAYTAVDVGGVFSGSDSAGEFCALFTTGAISAPVGLSSLGTSAAQAWLTYKSAMTIAAMRNAQGDG